MSVLRFRNNETGEWTEITTIKGEPGKDGRTPVKGVDYFDGAPGKDGADGYTPVKGVDYFDGEPGKDGAPGQDGKDYILTAADKQEIASMIEGGGGGGSGATEAAVFPIRYTLNTYTAEELAKLQEIYTYYCANGKLPYEVWFKSDNSIMNVVNVEFSFNTLMLKTSLGYENNNMYVIALQGNDNNILYSMWASSVHIGDVIASNMPSGGGGGWTWQDAYQEYNIYISSYSHVKLVLVSNSNSQMTFTIDISTTHGNTFGEECGTYYSVMYRDINGDNTIKGGWAWMSWDGYFQVFNDNEMANSYYLLGYYYQ